MKKIRKKGINQNLICSLLLCSFALSFGMNADNFKDKMDRKLKKQLKKMICKTSIATNGDLLKQINEFYGSDPTGYFSMKHPYFKEKQKAKIDLKTLQWKNHEVVLKENIPSMIFCSSFEKLYDYETKQTLFQMIAVVFKSAYKKVLLKIKNRKIKFNFHRAIKNKKIIQSAISDVNTDNHFNPEQVIRITNDVVNYYNTKKNDFIEFDENNTFKLTVNIF